MKLLKVVASENEGSVIGKNKVENIFFYDKPCRTI